jgi:hypothetical protein
MIDVSASGTKVNIIALQSFPIGFSMESFADDIDPLVAEEVESSGFEMLYDGSMFAFDKAAPIKITVGVIAGSSDDINLKIMLQARKSNVKILPFPDYVSMVITYPDGGRVLLSNGLLMTGPLADTVQATGRKKGNAFTFVFGTFAGAQSAKQLVATIASAALGLLSS